MPTPVNPYSEYGVALRTLRSARTWLGYGLFFCVVAQVLGFLLMWATQQPYESLQAKYRTRYDDLRDQVATPVHPAPPIPPVSTKPGEVSTQPDSQPSTMPEEAFPLSEQGKKLNIRKQWEITYTALVPFTQILGLIVVCSQVIVMFLTLLLILIAQAPGVVHVTRGLIWSILLACMVFPWQYISRDFPRDFPVCGILYGYQEMLRLIGPHVVNVPLEKVYPYQKLVVYIRFLLWPAVSMVVLLIVSERFRAGIMLAVGHPLQSMMSTRPPLTPGMPLPTRQPTAPKQ